MAPTSIDINHMFLISYRVVISTKTIFLNTRLRVKTQISDLILFKYVLNLISR